MKKKIYSIGIDVSKKTLDVCFLGKNMTVIKEFKINNNEEGVVKMIKETSNYNIDTRASILLESTSSYHLLPALLLQKNNYTVKVFNPIISGKYAKKSIRKCKTDKIDAKIIAEIGILENIPEFKTSADSVLLKRKINTLQTLIKQKQILSASSKQFKEDCDKLGLKTEESYLMMLESLEKIKQTIKIVEEEIQEQGKGLKGIDLVIEIQGVSAKSASIVLSLLADKTFESREAITAFAGLDISTKQSGTSVNSKGKLSKRGNTMLRKTLTQMAWGVLRHNKSFQKLGEYYKERGKHYYAIMTIIARKLLHIIYGMLKTNSHFDPAKIVVPKKVC